MPGILLIDRITEEAEYASTHTTRPAIQIDYYR